MYWPHYVGWVIVIINHYGLKINLHAKMPI